MSSPPTLSRAPLEHPALDYAVLRQEGIRYVERVAGHLWTDFNAHDPGITILEQICYAITDLAYRASHDVPDLLASSGDLSRSLYSPATILTSHPVTLLDLRKLVLDVAGVQNAWIEPLPERRLALHHHESRKEIGFVAEPPYSVPVALKGLFRVLLQTSDLAGIDAGKVKDAVARRLHAARPLCADFEEIRVLAAQPIQVHADVEIGPVDDAEDVLLRIYEVLSEHIAPSVPFATLGEMLAAGKRTDEIFDGPALVHGFLDARALARLTRKDALHTSDLIREIMSVPGVRAVRNIALAAGRTRDPWELPLDPDKAPRLDLRSSTINLLKGKLTARLDTSRVIDAVLERRAQAASRGVLPLADRDISPPVGRDRNVGRYSSIQHHLPALYGVGREGLPEPATDRRKAEARQLKAYLLFFDQLLAGYFAQLAHAGSLLSFHEDDAGTYFTQPVDDPALGLREVLRDPEGHADWLRANVEAGEQAFSTADRKNRFLNHLMARFAEQFTDYSLVMLGKTAASGQGTSELLAADKRLFLQRYPRISSARGTGVDVLSRREGAETAGLAERVQRKLGLSGEQARGERFYLVEHLLLVPMEEDNVPPSDREYRQIPFLSAARSGDPWSLQVSFVFEGSGDRIPFAVEAPDELRRLVEQTVREETPAHLTPYIHWLSGAEWRAFEDAYKDWLGAQASHRAAALGLASSAQPTHYRARDARDRLIDLLRFGETHPLRDLPVRERTTVPFNQPAKLAIDFSQRGVTYELRSDDDDSLILREENGQNVPCRAEGNGATLALLTPRMRARTTYNIRARKIATNREADLRRQVTVDVGLDQALRARVIEAPPLDPNNEAPADTDPRLVPFGARVRVQIDQSQEGVDYRLVQIVGAQEQQRSPDVRGKLAPIVLTTSDPVTEDLEFRIRATKVFDPSENQPTQTALLEIKLAVKVRARLDSPVTLEPAALVAFGEGATLRIDNTMATATYTVYSRPVSDSDFVFTGPAPGQIGADVEGEDRVLVKRPPHHPVWQDIEGFTPVGAAVAGNGAALRVQIPAQLRDSALIVRAQKEHVVTVGDPRSAKLPSSVQLDQAALLLVRPDPAAALTAVVAMDGAKTTGTLELSGGQPGVFYHARKTSTGPDLGLPAYFHKTDERNASLNKGMEQLRIGVDFAISRGPQRPASTAAELASTPPLNPLLDTGPLDAGTTLHFRAVKAQTRAAAMLSRTASIPAAPQIVPLQPSVPRGSTATVVVKASVAGDRYQLALGGKPIGAAQTGNGADLTFTTPNVTQDTIFLVFITRPADTGIPVERRVPVRVGVTP